MKSVFQEASYLPQRLKDTKLLKEDGKELFKPLSVSLSLSALVANCFVAIKLGDAKH